MKAELLDEIRNLLDCRDCSAVKALQEISKRLECSYPCEPRPGCDACGRQPYDNWCAGCLARKALREVLR